MSASTGLAVPQPAPRQTTDHHANQLATLPAVATVTSYVTLKTPTADVGT
ncbi:hypothetical protein [Streptomyces sp. NPDC010273]